MIEVKTNIDNIAKDFAGNFSKALIMVLPVPMILVMILGYIITRRIKNNLSHMGRIIDEVYRMEDLKKFFKQSIAFPLKEIDEVFLQIRKLIKKLSDMAVDKEVLEFELELLEKFILTSEVIKDWKEYVLDLLMKMNKIIPTYFIFSIFKEEDNYEVEIFWLGIPSEKLKLQTEQVLKRKVKESFKPHAEYIEVNHNIAKQDTCIFSLEDTEIDYKMKSLFLEKPQIGGIVGIGVKPFSRQEKTKILVVESILSTLLNVVGSVKAIYKYTKDLEYYATRDPLTELYNQRVFWELAGYEVGRAKRYNYKFSMLVMDIDNFKIVNDTYGHEFGDKFLIKVANLFEKSIRPGDVVARYGGDEFVMLLPQTDENGAFTVAKRILENAGNFFITTPDGRNITPKFSVGIATYPDHAVDVKELFAIADEMMYKAKQSGKGQIKLPEEKDILEFFKKENEISIVLAEAVDNKKIVPYFQPIFSTETGKVEAYEVLSRIFINGEIIPAHRFVEIAERTGLIFRMDLIVIEKALEKLKNRKGKIFINLSPKSLIIADYLKKVKEMVRKYRINPDRIIFEITERDTVKNFSALQSFVINLKENGFQFAIDDFGSGFSSFFYVKQLPIDYVKIEGAFIQNLTKDEKDRAFVESIVTLSQKLGIKTIAEFIEDEETYHTVKEMGIDYAQGYHLGKPSPEI
ncbi:MAG: bifunctional diguanylate cyclase/phosphodiesterase [Persephonella sp.]|nr:bifunctional diguanylate cyclase/phosphodiesterase [Persephonella sp.]